jgi:hypothetical protein
VSFDNALKNKGLRVERSGRGSGVSEAAPYSKFRHSGDILSSPSGETKWNPESSFNDRKTENWIPDRAARRASLLVRDDEVESWGVFHRPLTTDHFYFAKSSAIF